MFDTLLIANRGEIACRVAATARRLGIRTVAVYSDADAHARHVAACDMAMHIGGSEPRESYLRADAILEAARQTGAQAIHPGYGFLSENAAFAEACAEAGILFVGPPAGAIAAMGSKSAAKTLMEKAGVPLVPGYHGDEQDPDFLKAQADAIGYPVLIKASAGGGGKGMRIVNAGTEFLEALASCKREAAGSFGDERVLIERYLIKPRHIEIQVFGDTHGNYVHLSERDCSVQRRHQKVIEEAPAPGMTPERREAMGAAAVAAARAVNYVGAGTVEFIAEPDGRFYFMEMNTRLQVEHPVTEMITGQDLVEWQLRVAAGQPLPLQQDQIRLEGHAIEARVYAENPEKGFLPSIGTLTTLAFPEHHEFGLGDVRVDGGVAQGDTITPFYDPMIAKLIVRGRDRQEARTRMLQALGETRVAGLQTNIAFLRRLMADEAFASADLDTGLIERRHDSLFPARSAPAPAVLAMAAVARLHREGYRPAGRQGDALAREHAAHWADPWDVTDGWRVAGRHERAFEFHDNDGASHSVSLIQQYTSTVDEAEVGAATGVMGTAHVGTPGWTISTGDETRRLEWAAEAIDAHRTRLRIRLDGFTHTGEALMHGDAVTVYLRGEATVLQMHDAMAHANDEATDHGGTLTAPMPGKIVAVAVQPGAHVKSGDILLVMEAMKMEHSVHAPRDGTVQEIFFQPGDQVVDGAQLIALADD